MSWRNTTASYGRLARLFHWTIVCLVACQFALALGIETASSDEVQAAFYSWHESMGMVVLAVALLRLAWRLIDRPPAIESPPLLRAAAHVVHGTLYGLLLALPLTGYAMTNALGFPVELFGIVPLPVFVAPDRGLGFRLLTIHFWLGMALLALVAIHAGAALFHHIVLRDGTLNRMLPRRSSGTA